METLKFLRSKLIDDRIYYYEDIDGSIESTYFEWSDPLNIESVNYFEGKYFQLPKDYKELLQYSNGLTLFKDVEYAGSGCIIYGLEAILLETERRIQWGYELKKDWVVFAEWLGDTDFLVFDMNKYNLYHKDYIIHAIPGHPVSDWRFIKGNLKLWINRLILAKGQKYWEW